ncbi:MAG: UrcA family protein [Pseudomonadota bacterium]
MRKTIATLLAAALVVAPSAQAEGTPVTVEFQYDSEMLSTEAGAKQVLKSIKAQAAEACSFEMPVTRVETFDRACRKDLVEQAVGLIRLAAEEDGKAATYVFASL